MNPSEIFNNNKYIYLPRFLDQSNCQEYVNEFKKLIDQGLTTKDDQCPLSHSLGHSILFDSLLEQLTPNMEKVTGKKLHPTYAYARVYVPGDELKIHKDRPACEISCTITLGFEGGQWPIYVGHESNKQDAKQINMNIGDAVVYKGCELFHWREKYVEGQWQAQVFIHYVDAEGPNAEWKYDKRDNLAHHNAIKNLDHIFLVQKQALSKKQCQGIIKNLEDNYQNKFVESAILSGVDKKIRDSKKIQLDINKGIAATLAGIGWGANHHRWKFDVTHCNQSEYLRYDQNGRFNEHVDIILTKRNNETRKLTVIAFLNDDFKGGRLYIKDGGNKIYPSQEQGDVVIFPSFLQHAVEPIESGIRRSIVTWLVGPPLK